MSAPTNGVTPWAEATVVPISPTNTLARNPGASRIGAGS